MRQLTGEAVCDSVAVWVVSLQNVDDSVSGSVFAQLDVLDARLHKHRIFVVDVRHRHPDVSRPAQSWNSVVGRRHREVVRVVRQPVIVQPPNAAAAVTLAFFVRLVTSSNIDQFLKLFRCQNAPPHLHLTTSKVMVIVWRLTGNII